MKRSAVSGHIPGNAADVTHIVRKWGADETSAAELGVKRSAQTGLCKPGAAVHRG